MKVPVNLFSELNPLQLRNYLYTFGYLIISGFFSNEKIRQMNQMWEENFYNFSNNNPDNTSTYLSIASLIERANLPFFDKEHPLGVLDIVDKLIGEDAIYAGSGANEMSIPTVWHRDVYINTPVFKVGCYLTAASHGSGGELCVVPGTQHTSDLYSNSIGAAISWPEGGGIRTNPVQFPLLKAQDGSTTLDPYPNEKAALQLFPYIKLNIDPTDLLVFDQRIVHGSTVYSDGKKRRMLTAVFVPNPEKILEDSKLAAAGYKPIDALIEIEKWFQLQTNGSENEFFYHDLRQNDRIHLLLEKYSQQFSGVKRGATERLTMRDNLDRDARFYKKNMFRVDSSVSF
jgi:hypothetical protein